MCLHRFPGPSMEVVLLLEIYVLYRTGSPLYTTLRNVTSLLVKFTLYTEKNSVRWILVLIFTLHEFHFTRSFKKDKKTCNVRVTCIMYILTLLHRLNICTYKVVPSTFAMLGLLWCWWWSTSCLFQEMDTKHANHFKSSLIYFDGLYP